MYIKVVVKDNKTYYILSLYDRHQKIWCNRFISDKIGLLLINNGIKQK